LAVSQRLSTAVELHRYTALSYRWTPDNPPGLSLKVEGTLNDLANLGVLEEEINSEHVRESLSQHLIKHLKIAVGQRPHKAGTKAKFWTFVMTLWSTKLEENKERFWEGELLLERWDAERGIEREVGSEIYSKLSPKKKEQLLSNLAVWKFTQTDNFVLFEQAKLVRKITHNYLNL